MAYSSHTEESRSAFIYCDDSSDGNFSSLLNGPTHLHLHLKQDDDRMI